MSINNNERLLDDIEKKLYKVEGLLATPVIQEQFKKNNINTVSHLKTIETYLSKFDVLKKAKKNLLEIVKEHLHYIISHTNHIDDYAINLETKFFFF